MQGILASANYPMHRSVLEEVNNKIKVIKRMAYGFRDSEYFLLKGSRRPPRKAAMNLYCLPFGTGVRVPGQRVLAGLGWKGRALVPWS